MKKTLTLLTLILLVINGIAQTNFHKGYVVKTGQDTLRGLVEYGTPKLNESECRFKSSENAETVTYKPTEIKAYGMDNMHYYETRKIQNQDGEFISIFAEILVNGRINLFLYNAKFYVQKEDSEMVMLNNDTFTTKTKDGADAKGTISKYIDILNFFMQDQPSMQSSIKSSVLTQTSLTKLIIKYNQKYAGKENTYQAKVVKPKSSFGLKVGFSHSIIVISSDNSSLDYLKSDWTPSSSFKIGLFYEALTKIIYERVSFVVGLNYYNYNHHTSSTEEKITSTTYNTVDYKVSGLELPFGFKYGFPINDDSFDFGIGVMVGTPLSMSSYFKEETVYTDFTKTKEYDDLLDKKITVGGWGSIGYSKHINKNTYLLLEYAFELNSGYSLEVEYPDGRKAAFDQKVTNHNISVGIKF